MPFKLRSRILIFAAVKLAVASAVVFGFDARLSYAEASSDETTQCVMNIIFESLKMARADRTYSETHLPKDEEQTVFDELGLVRTPTAGIVEIIEKNSPHGPRYLVKRKWFMSWATMHGRESRNPQGDPRWFIMTAGTVETARFFGFEMRGDRELIVPSAERFNQAVELLNQINPNRLRIGMRMESASSKLGAMEYLRAFADEGTLPVAFSHPLIGMHDIAYHIGAMFMPPRLYSLARNQTRALLEFRRFVEETDPEFFNKSRIQDFFNLAIKDRVSNIDLGTGNFTYYMADYQSNGRARYLAHHFENCYTDFADSGKAPRDSMAHQILDSTKSLTRLEAQTFRALWSRFRQRHDGEAWFTEGLQMTAEEFLEQTLIQRRLIQAAVQLQRSRERALQTRNLNR